MAWTAKREPLDRQVTFFPGDLEPDYDTELITLFIQQETAAEVGCMKVYFDSVKGRIFYDAFDNRNPRIGVEVKKEGEKVHYEVSFYQGRLESIKRREERAKRMSKQRLIEGTHSLLDETDEFCWVEYDESLRSKLKSGI